MSDEAVPLRAEDVTVNADGSLVLVRCPTCGSTDDLWLLACAPGYTWAYVNGCGCAGFVYRKYEEN